MFSQGPGTRLGLGAVAAAAGIAAAAGAAQLGIGYGLGIFSWVPTVGASGEAAWLASLAWTVWISAVSVVLGAVVADRIGSATVPISTAVRTLRRTALAIAAAVGGLLVVALTAVPARVAERADTFAPQVIVGGYAITGVLLGLFVAVAALSARAVAANVLATGGWLWLLAVTAAVDGIAAGREPAVAQLGVWPVTADGPWFRSLYLPGAAIAALSALVIGFLAALPAVRRRDGQAGVVLSGAVGPALVALAYLLAAPKLTGVQPEQLSAHLVAPYAVVTGLIGAVLAQLLAGPRRPRPVTAVRSTPAPTPEPAYADHTTPLAVPAQAAPAPVAAPVKAKGTASVPKPAAEQTSAAQAVPDQGEPTPVPAGKAAADKAAEPPTPSPAPKNGPRQGRPRKG